jgi:hypothetical protein
MKFEYFVFGEFHDKIFEVVLLLRLAVAALCGSLSSSFYHVNALRGVRLRSC